MKLNKKKTGMQWVKGFFSSLFFALFVFYADVWGSAPKPWQMGFQPAATPVMAKVQELHHVLLIMAFGVAGFVSLILVYILWRFQASKNPIPSKKTHHTALEIIWTIAPVLILLFIAPTSLRLLYFVDQNIDAQVTIKVTGNQWYWTYQYPDHHLSFDSMPVENTTRQKGQLRLLDVDQRVIVPVNTPVRLLLTSADVIHSWAVPSFGVKKDCVPGRLSETWFQVLREGVYYGQCAEICGVKHGFMPIVVQAVSAHKFSQWLTEKKQQASASPQGFFSPLVQE